MLRASRILIVLAAIVTLPTAGLALRAVTMTAWQMFDPCVRWDASGSTSGSLSSREMGGCRAVTVNGESKLRAVTMALIPGGLLLSTVLAAIGVLRSRRWLIFAAAVLMLADTPVVFTIAPLTAVTGLLYLILANSGSGLNRPVNSVARSN